MDQLEQLATRIIAKETIEQIECDGVRPDLVKLVAKARSKGHRGFIVVDHGGGPTPFIAAFLGKDGEPRETTWASHATPEAALVALGG